MNSKTVNILIGIAVAYIVYTTVFPTEKIPKAGNLPDGTSYPKKQFMYWADMLDEALAKNMTEDEQAVYDVFKQLNNNADVDALVIAFGQRKVYYTFGVLYSLPDLISSKLSSAERDNINQILASKGITLRF